MARISTKPPGGMRDFLPREVARRRHVTSIIAQVYERYGFVPLETPSIENLAILTGKYGEDEKLIYRLLHRGEVLQRVLEQERITQGDLADLALRYDLTVPLARVVAEYGDLPRYFKRYQIQPVWRADRPGKGRFREFYQCDVDAIGSTSMMAEAEVTAAVGEALAALGFTDYRVEINHRQLLRSLIRQAQIGPDLETSALQAVDKFDKIGRDGVQRELESRGIGTQSASRLLQAVVRDPDEPTTDALAALADGALDEPGTRALTELRELFGLLASTPVAGKFAFSPRLARGLGYYTGPIFEVRIPGYDFSFAGGGRYDELVGVFGKRQVPAVGFSIGLERILVVMEDRDMYPPLQAGAEIVLCWTGVSPGQVLAVAHQLRGEGVSVEVFPDETKLKKQLHYAGSDGVAAAFAVIVGQSELDAGEVTLKDLRSGHQERLSIEAAAATVRDARHD